jgi:hypothetical protein
LTKFLLLHIKNDNDVKISKNHTKVILQIKEKISILNTIINDKLGIKHINIKEKMKSQNAPIIILFDNNLTKIFFGNNK